MLDRRLYSLYNEWLKFLDVEPWLMRSGLDHRFEWEHFLRGIAALLALFKALWLLFLAAKETLLSVLGERLEKWLGLWSAAAVA